ncbi:MAG: PilT/PilU family type 4a pilus ATPase [bacterium]|nr:PilT/PilU family type 4a pilus ATPase [bacterium]
MKTSDLLNQIISRKASDLHLVPGYPPILRIDGKLIPLLGADILTKTEIDLLIKEITPPSLLKNFSEDLEIDFSFSFGGNNRFRANLYHQKGDAAIALRLLAPEAKTIQDLHLPGICVDFCNARQGFILITGPTGSGKTTTIAAIISEINRNQRKHIITIEDPIEYIFLPEKSLISQREIRQDTHSWARALRSALREDPDIVVVGEMRDLETISAALTVAETGHLVFATLHTNSASQTIDRIVDVFPEESQQQTRIQLAGTLTGIISQRLVPAIGQGRFPACEILIADDAVRNIIREGKTHLLGNIIATSADAGMITLDASLAGLVKEGKVERTEARNFSLRPEEFDRQLGGEKV